MLLESANKKFIFYNLARSCIEKRKPVGSKFLAKKINNKLAHSTLRLYLRQMVNAGYLENAPYFSGRLPTSKGWYFYIKNFKLRPEKKIPEKFNQENVFEEIAFLTRNVIFGRDKSSSQFVIKGLEYLVDDIRDSHIIKDILIIVENLELLINQLESNKIIIHIGEQFSFSQSKKISLIAYRCVDLIVGFLGQQINCYHTNLFLLKNIFLKDEQQLRRN